MAWRNLTLATFAGCSLAVISPREAQAGATTNLDFETGDLSGFTQAGFINPSGGPTTGAPSYETFLAAQSVGTQKASTNAALSQQTGAFDPWGVPGAAILPTQGGSMAYVSNQTSAGNETLTGSSISQSFTIPVGVASLSLDLRTLNNDQDDARNGFFAIYNDFTGVALTIGNTVVGQYNMDLDPNSSANAHVTSDTNVGGFRNSTSWLRPHFSLAGLAGQRVTLTAYSLNYGGDNKRETRLLIDNIQLDPTSVPEPSTWLVGAVVSAVCGVGRFRRRCS